MIFIFITLESNNVFKQRLLPEWFKEASITFKLFIRVLTLETSKLILDFPLISIFCELAEFNFLINENKFILIQ